MTQLIIMRHAQAAAGVASDHERPLTQTGRAQATLAGRWLASRSIRPTHAIVSSSRRTAQTHDGLAATWTVETSDKCYNASAVTLAEVIRGAAPSECLLLIAHNPGATDLAVACGHTAALVPGEAVVVEWDGSLADFLRAPTHLVATFIPRT